MMHIRFKSNPRKALEVILWLANKQPGIDFHSILKILFFADVYHLNEYGRPIIGDTYNALPYGPVAQTTYDILKNDPLARDALGESELPFDVYNGFQVRAKRNPDLDEMSESDIEALENAFEEYGHLDFRGKTDVSHAHPAYRNAEARGVQRMQYEDFIKESPRKHEIIEDLAGISPRMVI